MKQLSDLIFEGGARVHGLPPAEAGDQPVVMDQLTTALLAFQALSARNQPGGYPGLDDDGHMAADAVPPLPITRILGLVLALADKLDADQTADLVAAAIAALRGAAGGLASLDADGVLPLAQAGAALITDVDVVDSEAEMLALVDRHNGDVCIRTDIERTFILKQAPASDLANWRQMLAPTIGVTSFAGLFGDVSAGAAKTSLAIGLADLVDLTLIGQAEAVAGTATTPRVVNALRLAQAITAQAVDTRTRVVSGGAYTVVADDHGRTLHLTHASPTITLPADLPDTFNLLWRSWGGPATFAAAAGGALHHPDGHAKSAKAKASGGLEVIGNAGGAAAQWLLSGYTAP